jgi:hypothetical protein
VTTQVLRYGMYNTVAATGEIYGYGDEPNVVGRVDRDGWRWAWFVTVAGRERASGRAWTELGAWRKANAAAHRPGITKAVTR